MGRDSSVKWNGTFNRVRALAMMPFWRAREREIIMLQLLAEQRLAHTKEKIVLEKQLEDARNNLKTIQSCMGTFQADFERDIPSFMDQTQWECGIYPIQDSEAEWYFNPSILSYNGEKHLFARRIVQTPYAYLNNIVRFKLTNNVPVTKHLVDIPQQRVAESFEDPRVMPDGKSGYWLSAVDFIQKQTFAHQIICQLDSNLRPQRIYHPQIGKNGGSLFSNKGHEKNWLWFWFDGRPHIVYWTCPHVVYEYDFYRGLGKKHESLIEGGLLMHGEPRGGTPPVLVDGEWWSFFHSFTAWKLPRRRYHMGALAFENRPPFRITRMTSLPLLSASAKDVVRDPLPITIFPCGAIFEDGEWLVTFGLNDLKCSWIRVPHSALERLTHKLGSSKITQPLFNVHKEEEREAILLDGKEFA